MRVQKSEKKEAILQNCTPWCSILVNFPLHLRIQESFTSCYWTQFWFPWQEWKWQGRCVALLNLWSTFHKIPVDKTRHHIGHWLIPSPLVLSWQNDNKRCMIACLLSIIHRRLATSRPLLNPSLIHLLRAEREGNQQAREELLERTFRKSASITTYNVLERDGRKNILHITRHQMG